MCALPLDCIANWTTLYNETRLYADKKVTQKTEEKCLEYCISVGTTECIGVDVDYLRDPVQCWLHNNLDDYVDSNIWSQEGTNSYQLLECIPVTATG